MVYTAFMFALMTVFVLLVQRASAEVRENGITHKYERIIAAMASVVISFLILTIYVVFEKFFP